MESVVKMSNPYPLFYGSSISKPHDEDCFGKLEKSLNVFDANQSDKSSSQQVNSQQIWLKSSGQIRGPSGSVRGHRDVVKKSLESINRSPLLEVLQRNFSSMKLCNSFMGCRPSMAQLDSFYRLERLSRFVVEEQDQCIAYTTSLGIVRRTFDDSRKMRSLLDLNLIKYEERDIYLNQEYRDQLRLRSESFQVPSLFVDGHHIGGLKEVELMNESGRLTLNLSRFKMPSAERSLCLCCGNARFIACQSCNGSRKSTIHHFKFNSIALRCIKCHKNDGLVQCPACCSSGSKQTNAKPPVDVNDKDRG